MYKRKKDDGGTDMNYSKFSLMTLNFRTELGKNAMSIEDTFKIAANEQIPFVDILSVSKNKMSDILTAMENTGVQVYCYISTVSLFSGERKLKNILKKEMKNAKTLNAKYFMIVPYYPIIDNLKTRRRGKEWTLNQLVLGFRIAVEIGRRYGLKVCFETTPQEDIHLSGIDDCRYVLEHTPGLGLVFDTANMLPHGDQTLAYYEALKSYIVHVHLKDVSLANEKPTPFIGEHTADGKKMQCISFGKGCIPVNEVYQRMIIEGYTGAFAIEYARPREGICTMEEHQRNLKGHLAFLEI